MIDFLTSLRDLFLAMIVVAGVAPLWLLPWPLARRVGRLYGLGAFLVWGEGRRAGMINLHRALGRTREEARRDVRVVFANLAQSIMEGIHFSRRYPLGSDTWMASYRAEDPALERRILADPRPKIFVMCHLGAWEAGSSILDRAVNGRGSANARRVDNRWLDRLVRRTRLRTPEQWIEKKGAVSVAEQRLRSGENVMMLLDENGGKRGPFVPFFGRVASTRKTPALLSLRTGAPIVVGAFTREGEWRFVNRMVLIDPAAEGLHGPDAIAAITERINAATEAWIRQSPLQWRWIHWRWRTRPDGSEERYDRRALRECFSGSAE